MPIDDRPLFRPAQTVDEHSALDALSSDSVERIRLTLIDGSRCLPDDCVFPHAMRFVRHEDALVRWAAVFALDQVRTRIVAALRAGEFDESEDHPIQLLTQLAAADSDPGVRQMAAATLSDIIGSLLVLLSVSADER